jgi:hypothetical protein
MAAVAFPFIGLLYAACVGFDGFTGPWNLLKDSFSFSLLYYRQLVLLIFRKIAGNVTFAVGGVAGPLLLAVV